MYVTSHTHVHTYLKILALIKFKSVHLSAIFKAFLIHSIIVWNKATANELRKQESVYQLDMMYLAP